MKDIKKVVKEKYSRIALGGMAAATGCCGTGNVDYTVFSESYDHLTGYNKDADLGLGCGLPTQFSKIRKGDVVIDLGSGAGNDCFVARAETGETGRVIGLDFSQAMLEKAKSNAQKLGFANVEFLEGDIESMPIADETAHVVLSNCVLNLVPDKQKAFSEIFRVLKPGGHFSISDVVLQGELPAALQHEAEMYAGCVSGAIQKVDYLDIIRSSGFENLQVNKCREIQIPEEILCQFLNEEQMDLFKKSDIGIFSLSVSAEKPLN